MSDTRPPEGERFADLFAEYEHRVPTSGTRRSVPVVGAAERAVRRPNVLVVVDGYNVAHQMWPGVRLERQRDSCVQAVDELALRWRLARVVVAFDGGSEQVVPTTRASTVPAVRVLFSSGGATADDLIVSTVRSVASSQPAVVITDDRDLAARCRALAAEVLAVADFRGILETL